MTALFTALLATARGRILLALAIAMTIVLVVHRDARRAEPPAIDLDVITTIEPSFANREAEAPPPADPNTATITEVHHGVYCGVMVGISEIRYGDRFTLLVPCLEFYEGAGLPFAIGDTHTVVVDDDDRVLAIRSNGRTWRFDEGFESAKAPAAAFGHVTSMIDAHTHYRAPGWTWRWH
jgi:hypothetical protein